MTHPHEEIPSLPVHGELGVHGLIDTRPRAADYASFITFQFAGNASDQPIRILNRDPDRMRALVQVTCTGGTVWIGKKEQVGGGNTLSGFSTGASFKDQLLSQEEVWVMSDGTHPATVAVMAEKWRRAH